MKVIEEQYLNEQHPAQEPVEGPEAAENVDREKVKQVIRKVRSQWKQFGRLYITLLFTMSRANRIILKEDLLMLLFRHKMLLDGLAELSMSAVRFFQPCTQLSDTLRQIREYLNEHVKERLYDIISRGSDLAGNEDVRWSVLGVFITNTLNEDDQLIFNGLQV